MADLRMKFCGIESPNPFWLASGPPTNTAGQVMRAFDAGWGGAVWKTIGEPIVKYVIPDVFVRRTDHGWIVEINQATVPRVRVNQSYANLISRAPDHAMLRTQLQEARWLMRSLEIRNETLIKVARCIVQRQTSFFELGEEAMEPLILKDVAKRWRCTNRPSRG